jgi:hypothetical protein
MPLFIMNGHLPAKNYHQTYTLAWDTCTLLLTPDILSLPISQPANLWGLSSFSRLLYRIEVWSPLSTISYDKPETTQAMAGRQLLGKSDASNMLLKRCWVTQDGCQSCKSSIRLAKMRLFNRLQFLPDLLVLQTWSSFSRKRNLMHLIYQLLPLLGLPPGATKSLPFFVI